MRYILLLLFVCVTPRVLCRPPNQGNPDEAESQEEEAEYEAAGDDGEAEDSLQDPDPRYVVQEETNAEQMEEPQENQRLRELNENSSPQRAEELLSQANDDKFPGYKSKNSEVEEEAVDDINSNDEYDAPDKQRSDSRYTEKPENRPEAIHASQNNDLKSLANSDKLFINKRTPTSPTTNSQKSSNEEGDILFEKSANTDLLEKSDKSEYYSEVADPRNRQSRKYYNSMQDSTLRDKRYQAIPNFNRDRRAVQICNETSARVTPKDEFDKNTEDEETAIKRHVKKLSNEELQTLISTLSEDKRELLKKIMDSDVETDNEINKREITKKASAAPDDNVNLESGQSEASKFQEGSANGELNSPAPSSGPTSQCPNSQTDINILSTTKTSDSSTDSSLSDNKNKNEFTGHDTLNLDKPESSATISVLDSRQAKIDVNVQEPTKTESKREAKVDEPADDDISFYYSQFLDNSDLKDENPQDLSNIDPGYVCGQIEDLSQFTDDEALSKNNDANVLKRETLNKDVEMSESMNSLEESFPNSNSYDDNDPYSGSDMAPLVRVKRKNKRAAGLLPEAKVAYFPNQAENDEDNEEGNEFDDEGFYDRTSHLANSEAVQEDKTLNVNRKNKVLRDSIKNSEANLDSSKLTQSNNMQSDIGSDTDRILSGIEGVDENLMFNSDSRNKRTAKDELDNTEIKVIPRYRPTPLADEALEQSTSQNYVPNYHENDAFGPLPRSYEGELGRYKRIRRVKQPQDMGSK